VMTVTGWIGSSVVVPDVEVDAPEMVEVTNESHENPPDHQYTVSIDDVTEELMTCTCPHYVHRSAFCKHMAAVENATEEGTLEAFPLEDEDDTEPEDCDCDGLGDFPCWPYVRTERKGPPN
jgi:SWIM zinc finger